MPAPSRRIRRALSAFAAALLSITALTLVVASPASAHDRHLVSTCEGLTVTLTAYSGSARNTVTVTIDGVEAEHETTFGGGFTKTYSFDNPAHPHDYVVSVRTSEDPDGSRGYTFTEHGTSTACVPDAPVVQVSAEQCQEAGATGAIVATVAGETDRSYTASLRDTRSQQVITTAPVVDGQVRFADLPTGTSYTVTVADDAAPVSVTSDPIALDECPVPDPAVSVTVDQCAAAGETSGTVVARFGLADGRTYTAALVAVDGGTVVETVPVSGDTVTFTDVRTGADYAVTITDTVSGQSVTSAPVAVEPCPTEPTTPSTTQPSTTTPPAASEPPASADAAGDAKADRTSSLAMTGPDNPAGLIAFGAITILLGAAAYTFTAIHRRRALAARSEQE